MATAYFDSDTLPLHRRKSRTACRVDYAAIIVAIHVAMPVQWFWVRKNCGSVAEAARLRCAVSTKINLALGKGMARVLVRRNGVLIQKK